MLIRFLLFLVIIFSFTTGFAQKNENGFNKTGSFINTVYEANKRSSFGSPAQDSSHIYPNSEDDEFIEKQERIKKFYESFNREKKTPKKLELKVVSDSDTVQPEKGKKQEKNQPIKSLKKQPQKHEKTQKVEVKSQNLPSRQSNINKKKYDDVFSNLKPYGEKEFPFGNYIFQRDGVYIVYTKKMLYFVVGGRVYGPTLTDRQIKVLNVWMSPNYFFKFANNKEYKAYKVGKFSPLQIKRFHIFWLANYNNKEFAEISTNTCYYTDILTKLNNYKVKFYVLVDEKRSYFNIRRIMQDKEELFPPIEKSFEGKFEKIQ